ncbi:hypothetical protein [Pseudotamlana agarivorans]|uniref:hypothetical protein n=1 Tax=Pseudotamlana agarivorans TaxID=481183 RepID=UPI002090DB0C|nr:hypothetical protein [Tamlana agarivorans]
MGLAKNEKDYIRIYEEKGYKSNFRIQNEKLISSDTKNVFSPEEIQIVAMHRYEGMSNPSDMSMLYIIEANKEEKGTFLMAYGPNAETEVAEFFNKVPKSNITNSKNINN